MICHLKEAICPLSKDEHIWCLRADFTNAFWVLSNKKKTLQGHGFPVCQVLNAVLRFLQHPLSYATTSVPWPTPEPPLADFAVAFGVTDDPDDEEPLLPPRMAYELMLAAGYIGDTLHDDDPLSFRMFPHIPRIARRCMRRSASWRKSFQQCYFRIHSRVRKGLMPTPNCTGEEMALHTLFDYVEADEHPDSKFEDDDIYWTLPHFPNDEDYSSAKNYCLEDFDVLELFQDENSDESSSEGAEDVDLPETKRTLEFMQSDIGRMFAFADMRPEKWFQAFYPQRFLAEAAQDLKSLWEILPGQKQ